EPDDFEAELSPAAGLADEEPVLPAGRLALTPPPLFQLLLSLFKIRQPGLFLGVPHPRLLSASLLPT
ncbi:hypothetical protein, partial [Micromonospora aurantiaca (nom. illeg.)]